MQWDEEQAERLRQQAKQEKLASYETMKANNARADEPSEAPSTTSGSATGI